MVPFSTILADLKAKRDLSIEQMQNAIDCILDSSIEEADIVRFLTLLRDKGETADELHGLVTVMRRRMTRVDLGVPKLAAPELAATGRERGRLKSNLLRLEGATRAPIEDFIDTCGTGGTGQKRFNISTAASLLAVEHGVRIVKHGNRAASSQSGSADFLEALGYPVEVPSEAIKANGAWAGFRFLYARHFHPAMAKVAAARKRVSGKTIFNCLGPLLNPAGVKRQIIGVYSRARMRLMADVLAREEGHEAVFLHGEDGMDEITLAGRTHLMHLKNGRIHESILDPKEYGLTLCSSQDLEGGSAKENAARFRKMIETREMSPLFQCILLNTAYIVAFYRREAFAKRHLERVTAHDYSSNSFNPE